MAEDELAIRHLVATYADAVNRRDQELWISTLSQGVSWTLTGQTVEGREAVIRLYDAFMGNFDIVVQLVHQGTVEVDGSRARGRWYLTELLRQNGASEGRSTVGSYTDEYVKEDGRWLFAKRTYEILSTEERSV